MVEAEAVRFGLGQRAPIGERLLQKHKRADDVGLHELGGSVDRAIDVAFRRQMQDHVRLEIVECFAHCRRVGDICANKLKAWMILDRRKRIEIAGIGELVDDKDVVLGSGKRMPNKGGADEPCPARHQKTLCHRGPVH